MLDHEHPLVRSYGTPNVAGREPPAENRVRADDGVMVRALDWRASGRPPFYSLHGAQGNATMWQLLADAFPGRRIASSDHRGYGETEGPEGTCTTEWHVKDADAVIRSLALEDPVLIGFSGGAVDSVHFAATHPGVLSALVVIDPPMFAEPPKDVMDFFAKAPREFKGLDEYVRIQRAGPLMRGIGLAACRLYATYVLRPGRDGVWRPLSLQHAQAEWNKSLAALDVWNLAAKVDVPTLLIRAGAAPILPQAVAERLVSTFRDGRLAVIEEVSHSIPFHDPESLHSAISEFIEEIGV